jgi:AraC-like DNA-binding protein
MGHVNYATEWEHFSRTPDEHILYLIISGEMFLKENDIKYHLKPNHALLLEPAFLHSGYQKSRCHYYYIHFSADEGALATKLYDPETFGAKLLDARNRNLMSSHFDLDDCDQEPVYFPKHFTFTYPWEIFDIVKQMDHIFFEKLEGRRKIISNKLEELLLRLSRNFCDGFTANKKPKSFLVIRKVQTYIHENYRQTIDVADIEKIFEMNYDYLNRIFKLTTGYTIRNYIILQKINHAKRLLESGNHKIGEIGYIVGVNDPYYFSKLFKKIIGFSPSDYIKHIKEMDETVM